MLKLLCALFAALGLLSVAGWPAQASAPDALMWRPYVIEKNCQGHFHHCKARMQYAPGQHAGRAGPGSYWYQRANLGPHDDFRLVRHTRYAVVAVHVHKKRVHKKHAYRPIKRHHVHAIWKPGAHGCKRTGWVFSGETLHFVSGVPRAWRCIPSYDRH